MAFIVLPVVLTVLLVLYLAYLYFYRKDLATFKSVLYPGLVFVALWIILYAFVFK